MYNITHDSYGYIKYLYELINQPEVELFKPPESGLGEFSIDYYLYVPSDIGESELYPIKTEELKKLYKYSCDKDNEAIKTLIMSAILGENDLFNGDINE